MYLASSYVCGGCDRRRSGQGGSQPYKKQAFLSFYFCTATPARLYGGVGSAHAACPGFSMRDWTDMERTRHGSIAKTNRRMNFIYLETYPRSNMANISHEPHRVMSRDTLLEYV